METSYQPYKFSSEPCKNESQSRVLAGVDATSGAKIQYSGNSRDEIDTGTCQDQVIVHGPNGAGRKGNEKGYDDYARKAEVYDYKGSYSRRRRRVTGGDDSTDPNDQNSSGGDGSGGSGGGGGGGGGGNGSAPIGATAPDFGAQMPPPAIRRHTDWLWDRVSKAAFRSN